MFSRRRSSSQTTLLTFLLCFALLSSALAPFTIGEAKSFSWTGQGRSEKPKPVLGAPAANLSAASWIDSSLSGVAIKAIHIQEPRTNLDQALSALGMTLNQYTDPSLPGIAIKKVHIEEIRQRVK